MATDPLNPSAALESSLYTAFVTTWWNYEMFRNTIARNMIPILHERELRASITPERAVDAIREAFRADGEGRTHVPAVINLDIPAARGEFHIKTAHIDGVPHVA